MDLIFSSSFIENNINKSDNNFIKEIINFKTQNKLEFINDVIQYLNSFYDKQIELSDILEQIKNTKEENNRNEQGSFRNRLIKKYKKCIITGFDIQECEACHIDPFSESFDNDINNGILLTASLHKTFDKYHWSINPKTRKIETSLENNLITNYKNKKIDLDKLTLLNLKNHYNLYKQNSLNN